MSLRPSFERIDYQLRYNKHIERKLVFDVLAYIRQMIGIEQHQYLGFGSMWFADFRLAHRLLGMNQMISMEKEQHADRAKFNSPYYSIEVKGGMSSDSLKAIDWSKPVIAWLDYDGTLDSDAAADLKQILQNCLADSVVIVTLNANRDSYRTRGVNGPRARKQTALGQVESMLVPGVVPARFEPVNTGVGHGDVKEEDFPEFLADSVLAYMTHLVNRGGGQITDETSTPETATFLPLFNLCHKDGVDMITVGGAVTAGARSAWHHEIVQFAQQLHAVPPKDNMEGAISLDGPEMPGDATEVQDIVRREEPESKSPTRIVDQLRLDLVPITLKEKLILDACLPDSSTEAFIERAKESGVCLDPAELGKYWRHYRHFPVFMETPI